MGELAALTTSLLWSFTSIQFTLAGRRIGSQVVNRVRLVLAVALLSLAHLLLMGSIWPLDAGLVRWGWLGLSGVVGLIIGDACFFQAFVLIGPRRSMLLMTLTPVISAILAWLWLREALALVEIIAVSITIGGVAWVVSERRGRNGTPFPGDEDARTFAAGMLLGLGGALGQAIGLVLAKQGLAGDFPPLSAALIRMIVAAGVIWTITLLRSPRGVTRRALHDGTARLFILGGAITGPFMGVWASMVAVQHAQVGIASTLMALPPILLIPLTHWIFHEQITLRAVTGTVIALAGAALIFLS